MEMKYLPVVLLDPNNEHTVGTAASIALINEHVCDNVSNSARDDANSSASNEDNISYYHHYRYHSNERKIRSVVQRLMQGKDYLSFGDFLFLFCRVIITFIFTIIII
jgi:hypothetical protein